MSKTVLQVPIDTKLRKGAEKAAASAGFSSVQEVVRVFLNKFAMDAVEIGFFDKDVYMSERAEKRYTKIIKDIENNKNIAETPSNSDLISILR